MRCRRRTRAGRRAGRAGAVAREAGQAGRPRPDAETGRRPVRPERPARPRRRGLHVTWRHVVQWAASTATSTREAVGRRPSAGGRTTSPRPASGTRSASWNGCTRSDGRCSPPAAARGGHRRPARAPRSTVTRDLSSGGFQGAGGPVRPAVGRATRTGRPPRRRGPPGPPVPAGRPRPGRLPPRPRVPWCSWPAAARPAPGATPVGGGRRDCGGRSGAAAAHER